MMIIRRIGAKLLLPFFSILLAGGCFIQAALISSFTSDIGVYIRAIFGDVNVAFCTQSDAGSGYTSLGCEYRITTEDGFEVAISTATLLSEFGLLGLLIDPLVIQVPDDIAIREASYSTAVGSGDLIVLERTSIPIDVYDVLHAEPGHKLVILDLPASVGPQINGTDPVNGLPVDYSLLMERNRLGNESLSPFDVKAIFTLPLDVGSVRYYLPMLPCVYDMSQVSAVTVNPAASGTGFIFDVLSGFQNASPCANNFFDFEATPQLIVSSSELEFGTVAVGDTQTRTLTLQAGSTMPLVLGAVQIPTNGDFLVDAGSCANATLQPGAQCEMNVHFAPSAAGAVADSIRLATNEPLMSQTLSLAGTGSLDTPSAAFSCESIDFGGSGLSQERRRRIALWNTGMVQMDVTSMAVAGSASFVVAVDECTGNAMAPGYGCVIELAYSSDSGGQSQGQLSVNSNAPALQPLDLTGSAGPELIHLGDFEPVCDVGP